MLTAFQLQVSEPVAQQNRAKMFLTKIALDAGEAPGPVIALVRAVVQPAPWGSGYLVVSAGVVSVFSFVSKRKRVNNTLFLRNKRKERLLKKESQQNTLLSKTT